MQESDRVSVCAARTSRRSSERWTHILEELDLLAEALEPLVVLALDVLGGAICGVAVGGAVVHGERGCRARGREEGGAVRVAVQEAVAAARK